MIIYVDAGGLRLTAIFAPSSASVPTIFWFINTSIEIARFEVLGGRFPFAT